MACVTVCALPGNSADGLIRSCLSLAVTFGPTQAEVIRHMAGEKKDVGAAKQPLAAFAPVREPFLRCEA
jgi:hypothetical protein